MQRTRRFTSVPLILAGLVASATGALAGFAGPALASTYSTALCGKAPLLPCNHLAVTGPIAAAPGVSFPLKARGYANPRVNAPYPANEVVGWNTLLPCKSTYVQELTAQGSTAANLTSPPVKHAFSETYTVPADSLTLPAGVSQEKVYWCAYLINSVKRRTFKTAFWTYTLLGAPGPGGPGGAP